LQKPTNIVYFILNSKLPTVRNSFYKIFGILAILSLVIYSCVQDESFSPGSDVSLDHAPVINYAGNALDGEYIVVFKEGKATQADQSFDQLQVNARDRAEGTLKASGINPENIGFVYGVAIHGFSATLMPSEVTLLRRNPEVSYIEQDQEVRLAMGPPGGGGDGSGDDPQTTPYGTTRVNGGVSGASGAAWIVDSGIDLDHPDLNVDAGRSAYFVGRDADDQNGHGSHVAGTVAAIDNSIGTIGVAAGATVIAIRVLDRRGSGSTSGVIAGVNHVAGNASGNDVANMSLGGGVSTALDQAVISASSTCPFVLAAGNETDDANNHSPARAEGPNVYTISAMNSSDNWASFSNFGSAVDYCAPGVSVQSTYKNGGYASLSGTSMAAPHAAGVILLGAFRTDGTVNGDPDSNADRIIVH
jgi:subtilisin family serine protease